MWVLSVSKTVHTWITGNTDFCQFLSNWRFLLFFPYCTDKPLLNMKPISWKWAGIERYLSQRISQIISDWGLELYSRQLLLVPVVCYPFKLHAQKLELLGAELQSACTHTATKFFQHQPVCTVFSHLIQPTFCSGFSTPPKQRHILEDNQRTSY